MKVKIGIKVYDSEKEPVMLILNEKDKINIKNMYPDATKFCSFPDSSNKDVVLRWMETPT